MVALNPVPSIYLSYFVYILCNQSPPSPRCVVEAGGGAVVVFYPGSSCSWDGSGALKRLDRAVSWEGEVESVRPVTSIGLGVGRIAGSWGLSHIDLGRCRLLGVRFV